MFYLHCDLTFLYKQTQTTRLIHAYQHHEKERENKETANAEEASKMETMLNKNNFDKKKKKQELKK